MFDICSFNAKNRVFKFDTQSMSMFESFDIEKILLEFVWCLITYCKESLRFAYDRNVGSILDIVGFPLICDCFRGFVVSDHFKIPSFVALMIRPSQYLFWKMENGSGNYTKSAFGHI